MKLEDFHLFSLIFYLFPFLSQTTPLFNIIIKNNNESIENMENDYLTNINNGKNKKLLSERNTKNNLNIIKEEKNITWPTLHDQKNQNLK